PSRLLCPPRSTLFPYTTLFRSRGAVRPRCPSRLEGPAEPDRSRTRLRERPAVQGAERPQAGVAESPAVHRHLPRSCHGLPTPTIVGAWRRCFNCVTTGTTISPSSLSTVCSSV